MKPEKLKQLFDLVKNEAREAGRNPAGIEFTAMAPSMRLDSLKELEAIGVARVVMNPPGTKPEIITRALEKFQEEVIGRV